MMFRATLRFGTSLAVLFSLAARAQQLVGPGSSALATAQAAQAAISSRVPPQGYGTQGGALVQGGAGPVDTNTVLGRTIAARAADSFNPRDFGAKGDGASHTVSATLGVSTLAGLTAYTLNGAQPYAFAGSYPYGTLFNLPTAAISISGSSTLTFGVSQSTGSLATGSGAYAMTMADVGGISQGMTATASGIPSGTQVEWVNPATLQIGLSAATTASIAAGASVSFVASWLSHVVTGMQVSGPGVPSGATVTAVSSPSVTISAPLTVATVAPTKNTAATPAYEGTAITFYAPFTNAQAAALQMDGLGIQAAVNAATSGGTVRLPANGTWLTSFPVITPTATGVTLQGEGSTVAKIIPQTDFGPSSYAISCGDPTATAANSRGMYLGGGSFCAGEVRDIDVTMAGSAIVRLGARPQIAGVPVAMGGIKQGPRENLRQVQVSGFNVGVQFQGDWTSWDYVTASGNFIGWRLDDPTGVLFGDLSFHQVFFGGNAFAGVSVSPQAGLIATHFTKSWIADQPYQIYLEPGLPTSGYGIDQSAFDVVNFEGAGCAAVQDGNITPADAIVVSGRHIQTSTFAHPFMAQNSAYALASGCTWRGYVNVDLTAGAHFTELASNVLLPVAGSTAPAFNVHLTTPYLVDNAGGLFLSGDGLKPIIEAYAGACAEMVSSGASADFFNGRGDLAVALEIPGAGKLHEFTFNDAGAGSPAKGTVLEQSNYFGFRAVQRAGVAASNSAMLLGTMAAAYSCNPALKEVTAWVEGQAMPVAVTSAQAGGTLLQVQTATPGTASSASTVTTGRPLGYVTDPNGGSATQVFMQGSFGRGGN